jgi:hypothetical protein
MKKGEENIELGIRSMLRFFMVLWSHFPEIVRKLEEPILAMVLIYISN